MKKSKNPLPTVKGKRTEGWLLKEPSKRTVEKSDFLIKLETKQALNKCSSNDISTLPSAYIRGRKV